jgi:hypothetical protein
MNKYRTLIASVLCAGLPGLAWGASPHITAPDNSALTTVEAEGWNFGVYFESDQRDVQVLGGDKLMESQSVMARVGYKVLPFLQVYVDGGWSQAQLDEDTGSGSASFGAGASASLAEYVIKSSPVLGKKETFAILLSGHVSQSESSLAHDGDLKWREYQLVPAVRYLVNLEGPENWHGYQPTGVALKTGVIFTTLDGDIGGDNLDGKRDAGFYLGVDMRMAEGWVLALDTALYGANDRTLRAGAGFYF